MLAECRRRSPVEPLPVTPLPSRLRPVAVVVAVVVALVAVVRVEPRAGPPAEHRVVERLQQLLVDLPLVAVHLGERAPVAVARVVVPAVAAADWRHSQAK